MGYLEFGLLLIVVTVCAGKICKPNEIKLDDNKICVCSSGGDHWNCEARHNPRNRRSEDDHCEPGKSFNDYCNICVCQANGLKSRAACTDVFCDRAVWRRNGTRRQFGEKINADEKQFCAAGTTFKKACNKCVCPENGLVTEAKCDDWECDSHEWDEDSLQRIRVFDDEKPCRSGTWSKKYCNTCVCVANGAESRRVCTKDDCDLAVWNEDGTPRRSDNDSASVDPKTMDDVAVERCEPGTTFKNYCNTCKCGSSGLVSRASCSKNFCDYVRMNKDGTPKKTIQTFFYGTEVENPDAEACVPGREFKKYCNTCVCRSDGFVMGAKCTTDFCDRGLWARDGTRRAEVEFVPMSDWQKG